MEYRIEKDTMGEVKVPAERLWGAQTQRSLENFRIGEEKMPIEQVRAIALIKLASARANRILSPERMTEEKLSLIESAVSSILSGEIDCEFPLSVYQTGSGTQTNMNLNEVIANLGNIKAKKKLLHPNDDVNMSQSSNDVFPSAMHIAVYLAIKNTLLPSAVKLKDALSKIENESQGTVKSGRTHLQDATPIAFSQEVGAWRGAIETDIELISSAIKPLLALAIGGTAVGTGLNAKAGFDKLAAEEISGLTGEGFFADGNKFRQLSHKSEICFAHGAMKMLAADLMKIANDIRWLASGPRCGLSEITIPENEPGSSIMPGKVNPTQCEAVTMAAARVMGNDTTVGICAASGNFQLNVYMPITVYSFMNSIKILSDCMKSFADNCVAGIKANSDKMRTNLYNSLMTSTVLTPYIGYDNTAKAVHLAHETGITLKDAVLSLSLLTEEEFDKYYKPEEMI